MAKRSVSYSEHGQSAYYARSRLTYVSLGSFKTPLLETFNKTFNRMRRDTGGWWRIVINYGAKSAKFRAGEGERGAIPTSASSALSESSQCTATTHSLHS